MTEQTHNRIWAAILFVFMCCAFVFAASQCTGCVAQNHAPPTTQQISDEISLDVFTGVDAYIATSDDPTGKAKEVLQVATDIQRIASSDIDLSDMRVALEKIVTSRLDKRQQVIARFVTNLAINHVKRRLGIGALTLIPKEQLPITRTLLLSAANAAIDAATPYTRL